MKWGGGGEAKPALFYASTGRVLELYTKVEECAHLLTVRLYKQHLSKVKQDIK